MTYIQSTLLPLDSSPFSTSDRTHPDDYAEILEYGTDADCRRALAVVVELLDGETIDDLLESKGASDELDGWKAIRLNGTFLRHYGDADDAEAAIQEYSDFFNDCVDLVEEYSGLYPCAETYNILPIVADTFREHDEMRTALENIRQAIKDGESLDYIASLLPTIEE